MNLLDKFHKTSKTNRTVFQSVVGVALATAFILLLPLLAMQFTDEVVWDLGDFVVIGALLFGTGITYELIARKSGNIVYRVAIGVALAAAFLLLWILGAVGIIGEVDNPANLMYIGVLAVGIIGSILALLQPHGMARAMFATALALVLVAVIALVAGMGSAIALVRDLGATGIFIALFAGSGWLFRYVARQQPPVGARPEG